MCNETPFFLQVLDEIGKLAREHQCDLILLTGGLCCASTPDDEVLIYVAHRLRKLVSRGTQNILFKTRQTPSGAPPCWMSQTTRITMTRVYLDMEKTEVSVVNW